MGIESFRADTDLPEILKDKDFMKNFKNKTVFYNTAAKRYYRAVKEKKEEPPVPKARVKITI